MHELLRDWSESDTWSSLGYGIQTNDVEAKGRAVANTWYVDEGKLTIDVTESLRSWQADPTSNKGWALISQGSNGVDFYASESGYAPRLTVETAQVDKSASQAVNDIDDDDNIFGGRGNDKLEGGAGDDRLDGSDAIAKGTSEYDILGGGLGKDTFVLGGAEQSYYLGHGRNDYARILDFNVSTDTLQLHGSAADYQSQQSGNHLELLAGSDLIAVLENTREIDLSHSSSVTFV